jgi:ParB family chromosome partitioning protein
MSKKKALGKGLSALLEGSELSSSKSLASDTPRTPIGLISLKHIKPNAKQPRQSFDKSALDELAHSIKQFGLIQPVTVRKRSDKVYELISGERRWRAAEMAGLEQIPAYIRETDDDSMLELALIENIQRDDLDPVEIAQSFQRMVEELGLTHEELGQKVSKSRSAVANYLRLLKLPDTIQLALRNRDISMGHARALISIDDKEDQLNIFDQILSEELSVRQAEMLVKGITPQTRKRAAALKKASLSFEQTRHLEDIKEYIGDDVEVRKTDRGNGRITIPFKNEDDLNRILDLLNP